MKLCVNKVSETIVDIIFCTIGIILMILMAVLGTIGFACLKIVETLQKHTKRFYRLRLM